MAISGTSTNYSGRKIDLHIMQGVKAPATTSITPSVGVISNYCTGIQKLVQRYAIMLLTELGSQEPYPEFGSNFLTKLTSSSSIFNVRDVYHIFAFANDKVSKEIIAYQIDNILPEDEQLNTASLLDVVPQSEGVALKIQIVPMSNTAVEFIIPLPN